MSGSTDLAKHRGSSRAFPFTELGGQPEYEIRVAVVPESGGVEVFYRQEYAARAVDLIWVGHTGD